jgi:fermentation-respiration switch protein FrsA (DUF1100 family)
MRAVTTFAVLFLSSCSPVSVPRTGPSSPAREWSTTVLLHGKSLELHVAAPRSQAIDQIVVLYASGDGGWRGAAVDMFHQIAKAGYYTIGFSSRAFLNVERSRGALVGTAELAAEYEQILNRGRIVLRLDPASRAIVTGWSRGAALAVLAASEPAAPSHILGVIAIGLSDGEDLAINGSEDESDDGSASPRTGRGVFDTYARIARLAPLPCAVIQASRDNYLPAARARQLFGPDTPLRRFYTIDARNHRFSGGKPAFNAALLDAMHWMVSQSLRDGSDHQGVP